jgi:hypothetical protein
VARQFKRSRSNEGRRGRGHMRHLDFWCQLHQQDLNILNYSFIIIRLTIFNTYVFHIMIFLLYNIVTLYIFIIFIICLKLFYILLYVQHPIFTLTFHLQI